MKNLTCILAFFITFSIFPQNTQSKEYLIKINLLISNSMLNKVESFNLPIIHIEKDYLITVVNDEELEKLSSEAIVYEKLYTSPANTIYFLLTRKNKKELPAAAPFSVSYTDGYKAIITGNRMTPSELIRTGYNVTALSRDNYFRNEKAVGYINYVNSSDSIISQVTSLINKDSVQYFIQKLQDFGTRFLFATNRDTVSSWIMGEFLRMGYTDVYLDSFFYDNTYQKNVVATLPGTTQPDKFIVTGGHHDSYSSGNPMVFAPGADDNASGTAAVLETARVLKAAGYVSEMTIKFITFAAEEYGLWGSKDYAAKALAADMDIKLMINHDMISHTYSPAAQSSVDINYYSGSETYRELAKQMAAQYSILTPQNGTSNSGGSDSHSFWLRGYKAVYFEETNFSPFYHSPQDIISNYNMEYCAEVIKASCATLLTAIVIPDQVQNYKLADPGTGSSVLASWSPNTEPDLQNYKIYVGTSSGNYNQIFNTTDTAYIITGLVDETQYFVAVSARDLQGNESILIERSIIPRSIPQAPTGVSAIPEWLTVKLMWSRNQELDLQGYNVYRSADQTGTYIKVNSSVLVDTIFIDNTASNGIYYFYYIKAIDIDNNESIQSSILKSRVVSLDQGILIVDETEDGSGALANPTDEQVDNFYSLVLDDFRFQMHDINTSGVPQLADLGAFSTVIWSSEDYTNTSSAMAAREILKSYMNHGGNFLYVGFKPSRAFYGSIVYPFELLPGTFMYDMLKIQTLQFSVYGRFFGGIPVMPGYNYINTDSLKTLPLYLYHLSNIESIAPAPGGTVIYTYDTRFDSTTAQAVMKGLPVGIEYLGNDYKAVTLSFPMYYMNTGQAKDLLNFILTEKFDELTALLEEEENQIPDEFSLSQNYPNPFNPVTIISYQLPYSGLVNISIYDILGREVMVLVNELKAAGSHIARFESKDLSSGIYFYKLNVNPENNKQTYTETRKMILLK